MVKVKTFQFREFTEGEMAILLEALDKLHYQHLVGGHNHLDRLDILQLWMDLKALQAVKEIMDRAGEKLAEELSKDQTKEHA